MENTCIYIIIPVFNRWHLTKACLLSLQRQTWLFYKIIVVDHGSTDGTSEFIQQGFPDIILLKGDQSMWWSGAINIGVSYALKNNAEYILTLNNDLIVKEDYLYNILNVAIKNKNSIIGSVCVDINEPDKIVFIGTVWNKWTAKYSPNSLRNVPYSTLNFDDHIILSDLLPGRGTLIPSSVFKKIGVFDEINFPHYMADEVFSLKAKKIGYQLIITTRALIYSHFTETGLNNHKKGTIKYLINSLTSIKSPNRISVRWYWSKNTPVPLLYFILDFFRVLYSLLFKYSKVNE